MFSKAKRFNHPKPEEQALPCQRCQTRRNTFTRGNCLIPSNRSVQNENIRKSLISNILINKSTSKSNTENGISFNEKASVIPDYQKPVNSNKIYVETTHILTDTSSQNSLKSLMSISREVNDLNQFLKICREKNECQRKEIAALREQLNIPLTIIDEGFHSIDSGSVSVENITPPL